MCTIATETPHIQLSWPGERLRDTFHADLRPGGFRNKCPRQQELRHRRGLASSQQQTESPARRPQVQTHTQATTAPRGCRRYTEAVTLEPSQEVHASRLTRSAS